MDFGRRLTGHLCLIMFILCELFFLHAGTFGSASPWGGQADPFQNADAQVRLTNPNGREADKNGVHLGRHVGVALIYVNNCLLQGIDLGQELFAAWSCVDVYFKLMVWFS